MLPAGSIQRFHHDLLHPGGFDGGDTCVSWDTSKAPGCYREMDTSNQTWRAAGKSRTKWRFSYFSSLRAHQQCWEFPTNHVSLPEAMALLFFTQVPVRNPTRNTHASPWSLDDRMTVMSYDIHDDQRRDLIKQASLAPDILQWTKYVFNK